MESNTPAPLSDEGLGGLERLAKRPDQYSVTLPRETALALLAEVRASREAAKEPAGYLRWVSGFSGSPVFWPADEIERARKMWNHHKDVPVYRAPPAVSAPKLESELYVAEVNKLTAEVAALKERLEKVIDMADGVDLSNDNAKWEGEALLREIAALARGTTTDV